MTQTEMDRIVDAIALKVDAFLWFEEQRRKSDAFRQIVQEAKSAGISAPLKGHRLRGEVAGHLK